MSRRSKDEWVREYSAAHQNPVNRVCHTIGIPMIAMSILLLPAVLWVDRLALVLATLFVAGWVFQFVGHAFEGKPPEFFKDWRFLFVGLRWWFAKMAGKA